MALVGMSGAAANVASAYARTGDLTGSPPSQHLLQMAANIELAELMGRATHLRGASIPLSEYRTFSGIGAVVCTVDGKRHASTAFLVGKFDIAVTVAHTFEFKGRQARPEECLYLGTGPFGQIRERIAVEAIKSQWRLQPDTFGRPDSDLAVIRLQTPVQLAQRTLSFSRFAHTGAPVALIGFSREVGVDPLKRRRRGNVYPRPGNSCVKFAHDVNSQAISSGAPLIDRRDGVVIGIHSNLRGVLPSGGTDCADRGNAMLLMNQWLERTLRAEID